MRHLVVLTLLLVFLGLVLGCGSGVSPNLSGNWLGQSNSSAGGSPVSFTFTMQEGALSGTAAPLTITNLALQVQNNCFGATSTATADVNSGNPRTITGVLYSGPGNTGNQLSFNLQVATDNNSATGTYNLVGGSGACAGNDFGSISFVRQ